MRGRTLNIIGILVAIIGGLLTYFHRSVSTERIVEIGGVIFVAAGLVNLLFFNNGNGASRVMTSICNAAAIIFGVCMLVFRSTFEPIIPFAFGLIIAISALWQFYALAVGIRPRMLPAWLYFFPILLVLPAIYIFIFVGNTVPDVHLISIITGISLIVFGVGAIIEGCMLAAEPADGKKEEKHQEKDKNDDGSADLDEPAEPEKKEEPKHEPEHKEEGTDEPKAEQTSESGDADLDDEVSK